ncbi:MAG: DUF4397 domain-containing protein [Clostridia bacterium]|nr:DUF4397 domain-containing protein [Clostridia bacterium]
MGCNVRVINACHDFCLDFYTNDLPLKESCSYKYLSDYTSMNPGDHIINVYKSGNKHYPILKAYTKLVDPSCHTIVATGPKSDLSIFLVPDAHIPIATDKAYIRFVNLAYSTNLDFTFTDGGFIMANNIEYKEVTQYYPATPGTYTVHAYISGTKHLVKEVPNVTLRRGRAYTIYIMGSMQYRNTMDHIFCVDGVPG